MKRLNLAEIETRFGYKSFELWQGDLTAAAERFDALAVSAIVDNYELIDGTVIQALDANLSISVAKLAENKALDFRSVLDCWISQPLVRGPFSRIVCVESMRGEAGFSDTIENVFVFLAALEAKGITIETFLMPLLGAGNQAFDPARIIDALVPGALAHLSRSITMKRLLFVAYESDDAALLSSAMDAHLGRVIVESGPAARAVEDELEMLFNRICDLALEDRPPNVAELQRMILSRERRAFEVGISARRLVEFIVSRLLGRRPRGDLMNDIEALASVGVAPWIRSYMHTLRVLGNEQAHVRTGVDRSPPHITPRDVALSLACVERLLDFWIHRGTETH